MEVLVAREAPGGSGGSGSSSSGVVNLRYVLLSESKVTSAAKAVSIIGITAIGLLEVVSNVKNIRKVVKLFIIVFSTFLFISQATVPFICRVKKIHDKYYHVYCSQVSLLKALVAKKQTVKITKRQIDTKNKKANLD